MDAGSSAQAPASSPSSPRGEGTAEEWRIVRSGMILKQSSGAVWKTWFATLRVKVSNNPFLDGGSGEVQLYAHADMSEGPRRTMKVVSVRRFSEEENTSHGECGLVLKGANGKQWTLRALTEDDAENWLAALGDATKAPSEKEGEGKKSGLFSAWSTAAACAGAAAVSTGATALFVASAATGAGVAVAGVGVAVNRFNRRRDLAQESKEESMKKSFSEVNMAEAREERDVEAYGELSVSIRMARVMRSGGVDDALPPTLKIDGEVGSKTVNLETPLVFVARCGDRIVGSRPIVSALDLERIDLQATFGVKSARAVLRLELRAGSNSGQLVAARSIGMAEIVDRDAEIDVRRTRTQLKAAVKTLRNLIFGQDVSPVQKENEEEEESSSSSEDEPLEHSRFHARPRPSSSSFDVTPDPRVGWYTLYRVAKKDSEQPEEEEEDLEDCSFVEAACDDAGGVKSGTVGGLVLAEIVLDRRFFDMLRAERAELDRPARDEAPDPRAILESLKRGVAVVSWATAVLKRCDALLRWDDWRSSLFTAVLCALFILLWARDYCFALPPAASLVFLIAMGHARLTGDWLVKRVVVGKGGDDDILEGVVACYKDDDRGRRKWRLHRPRDVSTLDVSLDRIVFERNSKRNEPLVVVVKFVPGASRAALATRLVAASYVVSERIVDESAAQVRRACRDAMEAVADVDDDLVKPNGDWPALAAPLRAFKVGKHTFIRDEISSSQGANSYYGPAKSSLVENNNNNATLSFSLASEQKNSVVSATSVAPTAGSEDETRPPVTPPRPAAPSVPPPDSASPSCLPNPLATSTPARVGIGSRAQYEAERLMAWTSQFVGSQADAPTPHLSTPSKRKKPDPFVASASAKYHERIRSGRKDPRKARKDEPGIPAKWSLPVLRELERDAGGNAYTAAIPTAWRRARGQLRIEVYVAKKRPKKRTTKRIVTKHDAARAIFATAFSDKASRFYQPTHIEDSGGYDSDATSQTSAAFTVAEIEEEEEDEQGVAAPLHEECEMDDALGLAPRSDARLVGVAVLPLARVGPRSRKRWLDVVPVDTTSPRRWWRGRRTETGREMEEDDEESEGDGEDAVGHEEEKSSRGSIPLRCRVRVECRLVEDEGAVAQDGGVSLSQWHALDTLEDALEMPGGAQTRDFVDSVRRAAGFPDIRQAISVPTASENQEQHQSSFRVLERFRRARRSAIEIQNSLNDIVRVCEQWRALIEWVHPKATLVLVCVLVVATYVATKIRADIAGILGVAAAFGPGLFERVQRAKARAAPRAHLRRLADDCDAAARLPGISAAASSCATAAADGLRSLASSVSASHGAAERMRASATARPALTPAFWRVALASLLEGLPAEPELDAVFAERRRSAEWRRERAAVARALRASWVGPLWRRSVSWRRHFAAVTDNRQLCFWYSARHALNGVSPVLVVLLNNASLAAAPVETAERDLPVITIHAPALHAPGSMREWRLAAAHYRDASNLRHCIETQIADEDDETSDIFVPAATKTTTTTTRADVGDDLVDGGQGGSADVEEEIPPPLPESPPNLRRRRPRLTSSESF